MANVSVHVCVCVRGAYIMVSIPAWVCNGCAPVVSMWVCRACLGWLWFG